MRRTSSVFPPAEGSRGGRSGASWSLDVVMMGERWGRREEVGQKGVMELSSVPPSPLTEERKMMEIPLSYVEKVQEQEVMVPMQLCSHQAGSRGHKLLYSQDSAVSYDSSSAET